MFDKLIDLVAGLGKKLLPFTVIGPWKRGVVVRLGQEVRQIDNENGVLGTGFHWLWPLGVEEAYVLSTSTRLAEMQAQTLVTKDGKQVVAGIVITYRVRNISKAIFSVWDAFVAAQDACQANFATAVLSNDYDYIRTTAFADALTQTCREQGFKYGFEIDSVRLHEFAPARTIRLVGDGSHGDPTAA